MAWVFKAPAKAPSKGYPDRQAAVEAALDVAGVEVGADAEDRSPQEMAWHRLKKDGWAVYEAA